MTAEKKILRWDKFVFYSSLAALLFLAFFHWYYKNRVLPKQKEIIESRSYQIIKSLEKENRELKHRIDSLDRVKKQ